MRSLDKVTTEQSLVTVLIDTYNYGRFIEEAIDSVLLQDFPMEQVQVLVVDDGSTDDTAERVKKYGSRIEYFYKTNGGQASSLNAGFTRARGKIVVLLDADDYFLQGKLRRVVEVFQDHPEAGLVYNGLRELHADTGRILDPEFQPVSGFLPNDLRKLLTFCAYPTSCLAFRRQAVERVLPIPESLRLQADGYIELLCVLIAEVVAIPEVLSVYRIHGENLFHADGAGRTRADQQRRVDSYLRLMREVRNWIRRHRRELGKCESRLFLESQDLRMEEYMFRIHSPGRFRFFWFLHRQNRLFSRFQTWKFTLLNYLVAFASLARSYRSAKNVYVWRARTVEIIQSFGRGRKVP
jgi:glycosyltransferase involved in cell wall biosynthesis